jgi:hypothetical protein
MKTVAPWVIPFLKSDSKILFITENCPNSLYYFYRSLDPSMPPIKGANNLLINLCKSVKIVTSGRKEKDYLKDFLSKYSLIDTYVNFLGTKWNKLTPQHHIKDIINDIKLLNPDQIVFTCKRSNTKIILHLETLSPKLSKKIIYASTPHLTDRDKVYNSPSDRAYTGFSTQISAAVAAKRLIL